MTNEAPDDNAARCPTGGAFSASDDLRLLHGARARVAPEHMAAVFATTPDAIAARLRDLCRGEPDHASISAAIVARANGPLSAPLTAVEPFSAVRMPSGAEAAVRPAQALCEDASCGCVACQWFDNSAEAMCEIADQLGTIQAAALIIVTADPDEPGNPDAHSIRLISFGREAGVLAAALETVAEDEESDDEPEAAPALWVN